MSLTLYSDRHWESPYVFSCWVALKEKEIPFEVNELALDRAEQRSESYALGRVPAIEHDGFFLSESQAILEYLDEAFPETPRMLPIDLRERARARMVLGWIRSDLLPLRQERSTTTMLYERAQKPLSQGARAAADRLLAIAERLLPEPKDQLFSTFSVADTDLAFMLHRLILSGETIPERLRAFAERHWSRESVQSSGGEAAGGRLLLGRAPKALVPKSYVTHPRPAYVPH